MENVSEQKTLSFMGLSTFIHVSLVAAVATMNFTTPPIMPEVIEFEIATPLGQQLNNPLSDLPKAATNSLPNAEISESPQMATKISEEDVVVKAPAPKKSVPKSLPKKIAKAATTAAAAEQKTTVVAQESLVEAPQFDEDLKTDLNFSQPQLDEKLIDEEFTKVDSESSAKISSANESLEVETDQALNTTDGLAEAVKTQTSQDADRLKAFQDSLKKSNSAAVASAQAREAALRAQAEQAAKAQASGAASTNSKAAFGTADGVRSLEELKQRPGNKRPQYDSEDRLYRRQGEVSFLAYISKDGAPVKFKMIKSSGHRTLDYKTLTALKSWKFYPGQEGWVEIPFKWDLRGGPQEIPARLRTKISQF